MKTCLKCDATKPDDFCSSCGSKLVDMSDYAESAFLQVLKHLHENKKKVLSPLFSEVVKLSDNTFLDKYSKDTIFKSFRLNGYLLRTAEEYFGKKDYANIESLNSVCELLKDPTLSIELIDKAKVLVVSNLSGMEVGFQALPDDLFIIDKSKIVDLYNSDVEVNFENLCQTLGDKVTDKDTFFETSAMLYQEGYAFRACEMIYKQVND